VRSLAVHADPLHRGSPEPADVVVSESAIGYQYKNRACIAHHTYMSREALTDLVVVASRLLDSWAAE
jgi:hypothetical protein